jgi:hypothetical protein
VLEVVADWRTIREGRRFKYRIVHGRAVGRGVGGRRADSIGPGTPDLLELSGRNIGTVIGSNGSPELLAASLVNGTETVGIDNLGLVGYLGVDAESIERLGRFAGGHGARLGKEDLVLTAARRSADRSGSDVRAAASVAQRRAVTGRLRIFLMVHCHCISRRCAGGAA